MSIRTILTGSLISLLLFGCGIRGTKREEADIQASVGFRDSRDAPPRIRDRAAAVVKISVHGHNGTGSFVKVPDGRILLMTNHHVVGADECFREGCYILLSVNFARGAQSERHEVYVVPVAADASADVAFYEVHGIGDSGKPLTEHWWKGQTLEFAAHSKKQLAGQTLHLLGHPSSGLRKWQTGSAFLDEGDFFKLRMFVYGGSSGSPVLNDAGSVVGIVHSSTEGQEIVTRRGVSMEAFASASDWLLEILHSKSSLEESEFISRDWEITFDQYLSYSALYINGRSQPKFKSDEVDGGLLPALAKRCEVAIEKFDAKLRSTASFWPCRLARSLLNCRDFAKHHQSCPNANEAEEWKARFAKVAENVRRIRGRGRSVAEWISTPTYLLASRSGGSAATAAAQELSRFYAEKKQPLSLVVASEIANMDPTVRFDGKDLVQYLLGYEKLSGYEFELQRIAETLFSMYSDNAIDKLTLLSHYNRIMAHAALSVGARISLEADAYNMKLID